MPTKNFYDIIISSMNEIIYSIQVNLALVPQDKMTLCKNSVL